MKTLYDGTDIGSLKFKNRVFRAAIGDVNGTDGYYSEADLARYRELADGNIGLIITGEADVSDYQLFEGGKSISIQDDRYIDSLKRLTRMIHEHDGKIMIQLVHYGAETFMQGVDVIAPSDVPIPFTQQKPRPMTLEDISRVVNDFGKAARRAEIAGFDGIEIHAGHGFLISEFLSPCFNLRTDQYGGSDENRARILVEVLTEVRKNVSADYPVFVKLNCTDGMENGISEKGFLTACRLAEEAGANLIEVSGDWLNHKEKAPYFLDATTKCAEELRIPVALVGGVRDVKTAESVLNQTKIQYISMARPFINDPYLLNKWMSGETTKSDCRNCNACTRTGLKCPFRK